MVEDPCKNVKRTFRKPGDSIEGDDIIVTCRKPSNWKLVRLSEQHQGHMARAKKNALAVLNKSFTNLQK